ncbi:MAG: 6-phosphogluconolactonase [Solirubrobacterales bacterium]
MTSVFVGETAEEASQEAARQIRLAIENAREARGVAHIALAGGGTPKRAYELLRNELGDWSAVEIWFGDERAVGAADPDSNYRMLVETLMAGGGPEASSVHRCEGELGAEAAAASYAALLTERVAANDDGIPVLDLAFQGLGPDGHTASLFPGNPGLDATGICVPIHDSPKPPPDRITMTLGVLQEARSIAFMATGESKATPAAAMLEAPDRSVPASLLGGERTTLIADAAALPGRAA